MDLEEAASVGGFFALRTRTPDAGAGAGAHVPLARIYAGDLAPLTFRVDKVAARLGAPERRVAASIAHLGLVARLWSLALGPAALYGEFPDLPPDDLRWNADLTSPHDLWLAAPPSPLPATADRIREVVQYGHLLPLADAFRQDGRISRPLLWGNAGSALAGAARELHAWARKNGRPEVGERALELAAELFRHPDLRATGTLDGAAFRRRSCCLYYRCPSGGLCGDCVFDHSPQRSSAQRASE
ncbi:(2Fe-2S)-binding protein [Streptomyces sp. ISL-96]|uniref:(2Fe-2S)-binding protein n=1 Tax=Streptomyces sp. ISL-96 TaxID=2819191 RepID=UPI001BEC5F3D|nr:(2Fe-2S)-binding protein [Streptomyces sp. ISL-96]MBT2493730.1 (2Fe-2S)-binding protein [Streptomyces sp. ISL-96]